MSTLTFNTLDAVHRLRDAGFDERQAEAVVRVLDEAQSSLVTREHFDAKLETMEARLSTKIESQEQRLIIKLGGIIAVAAGIIIAFMRLPH